MTSFYTDMLNEERANFFGFSFWSTAFTAKLRLQHIIRRDREACGDGRWELSGINLSGFYLESCLMKKKQVSFQNKPRCRWEARR